VKNCTTRLAFALSAFLVLASAARAQQNAITLGYSGGTGLTSDLRRVIEKERIWEKHGLSVKAIYFNSGSLMAQAMAGGSITAADSDLPAMLNLAVSGITDMKTIAVTINRLEHIFVTRKNIAKPEDLKGKRIAVSRLGSASDFATQMVLRTWKIDPAKDVTLLQAGNTPTRMTALVAGHVDAALIAPDVLHKVLASGCCHALADLSELPLDYARFGVMIPTVLIKNQRDMVRRMLLAYVEGVYLFKTRPKLVYGIMEDAGIKDPAVQKELYDRESKSFREFPVPEANGIQNALDTLTHPNAKTAKPAQLMDTSLLEEIKKSGFIEKLYGRAS
jgi:ABC-type nitrate/sulfonate/bicarbonate transport system substrate-binding protein